MAKIKIIFVLIFVAVLIGIALLSGFHKALVNDISPEQVSVSVSTDNYQSQQLSIVTAGGRIIENSKSNFIPDPSRTSTYNLDEDIPVAQRGGNYDGFNDGYLTKQNYSSNTVETNNIQIGGLPPGSLTNNLSATCTIISSANFNQIKCTHLKGTLTVESQPHLWIEGVTFTIQPTFYKAGYNSPILTTNVNQNNVLNNSSPAANQSTEPLSLWQRISNFFHNLFGGWLFK